jgi:hypothetical protein
LNYLYGSGRPGSSLHLKLLYDAIPRPASDNLKIKM